MPESRSATEQTLFISDLHLHPARPELSRKFLEFLLTQGRHCEALYILGDLFEVWIGDDIGQKFYPDIIQALAELNDLGKPLYYIHGNRDFLIGSAFQAATGLNILPDPYPLHLYGHTYLLSHGDILCTNDVSYQRFRKIVRSKWVQTLFLNLPNRLRMKLAVYLREKSKLKKRHLYQHTPEKMDVCRETVNALFNTYEAPFLIHGHTHLHKIEYYPYLSQQRTRIVLAEWLPEQGNYLSITRDGYEFKTF